MLCVRRKTVTTTPHLVCLKPYSAGKYTRGGELRNIALLRTTFSRRSSYRKMATHQFCWDILRSMATNVAIVSAARLKNKTERIQLFHNLTLYNGWINQVSVLVMKIRSSENIIIKITPFYRKIRHSVQTGTYQRMHSYPPSGTISCDDLGMG